MKASAIIETENNSYRFKLKYSTLCSLKELGVDLLTEAGSKALAEDPSALATIFWKGLEAGEMKKYTKEEAYDIFDEIMEEVGPEEFSAQIPKALAIKQNPQKK